LQRKVFLSGANARKMGKIVEKLRDRWKNEKGI
jgi:hypothetical protein